MNLRTIGRPRGAAVGRFVYGRSYLESPDAVAFDPVELNLGFEASLIVPNAESARRAIIG